MNYDEDPVGACRDCTRWIEENKQLRERIKKLTEGMTVSRSDELIAILQSAHLCLRKGAYYDARGQIERALIRLGGQIGKNSNG